jgi:hypothetical protein
MTHYLIRVFLHKEFYTHVFSDLPPSLEDLDKTSYYVTLAGNKHHIYTDQYDYLYFKSETIHARMSFEHVLKFKELKIKGMVIDKITQIIEL